MPTLSATDTILKSNKPLCCYCPILTTVPKCETSPVAGSTASTSAASAPFQCVATDYDAHSISCLCSSQALTSQSASVPVVQSFNRAASHPIKQPSLSSLAAQPGSRRLQPRRSAGDSATLVVTTQEFSASVEVIHMSLSQSFAAYTFREDGEPATVVGTVVVFGCR